MIDLKQTETSIYYFHDYIPTRRFDESSDEEKAVTRQIWDYKNGEEDALDKFTSELMEAITLISERTPGNKIGLIAVPPSKVNKSSSVRTSIETIENWYQQGIAQNRYHCTKKIYDFGNLLTRDKDISTAHEGRRATYDEQKESLVCSKNKLFKYKTTFIIIDDVTTLGTSMDVCRDVLIEHGLNDRYIYRLAIARTI